MLRLAGAVLLMGGASAIGFLAAAQLRARVRCLSAFSRALEYIERELRFRLTPIPDIFNGLKGIENPHAAGFFAACSKNMRRLGEKPLNLLWREALEKTSLPLQEDELCLLAELGDIVGRYDAEGQREAFALARERLGRCILHAEEDRDKMEKVYGAMGISAGAFMLLVLL